MKNCNRLYAQSNAWHVFNKGIEKSYDLISDCFDYDFKS